MFKIELSFKISVQMFYLTLLYTHLSYVAFTKNNKDFQEKFKDNVKNLIIRNNELIFYGQDTNYTIEIKTTVRHL